MSRMYTVVFDNVAVTAAQDLFELVPAANKPIAIAGLFISQSTETGDAQEEFLRLRIIRGHTTSGSGGTAPTPASNLPGAAAASFTAEANNTTVATGGTPTTHHIETFNVRVGYPQWWPDGAWIWCTAAQNRIVVNMPSTPADSVSMSGTIYVLEGG